jgi:hypothetical protein
MATLTGEAIESKNDRIIAMSDAATQFIELVGKCLAEKWRVEQTSAEEARVNHDAMDDDPVNRESSP